MFLNKPTVHPIKPKSGVVAGITVLGSSVFVTRNTSRVDVYNSVEFLSIGTI